MNSKLSNALNEHLPKLKSHAVAMTRDPNDADDIVQECVKRAIMYIHDGSQIRNMQAYLFMILNNVYMDELSRRKKCGTTVDIETMENTISSPPSQIPHMECLDLSRAFAQLSPDQRKVVQLVSVNGMSYRAAAKQLHVPIGTVMSRLNRARAALRERLA